jgi:ATP-binding cassette, subfamily B (MDR/TAP), member 1
MSAEDRYDVSSRKPVSTKDAKKESKTASLSELFSSADFNDVLMMCVGTFGAVCVGASLPIMMVILGQMLDSLNNTADLQNAVNQVCIRYAIVGAGTVFVSIAQVVGWTYAGERQSQRLRERYVKAILAQEIGWFDLTGAGELSTRVADNCGKVQDGIGRKVGDLIQNATQFVGGIVAALYQSWKLTVVLFASMPVIAFAG